MSMICQMCGKGPTTGNQVSHSNRKTRRRWLPNLQTASVLVKGKETPMRVCTRCLRTNRKNRVTA
ncbi:MAG: 50S ribosomal protein L28 [Armatimonadetes bacterium]|nr:50S ribosomal protein L28 [Armatimonadota bacterium]